jgi:hypothetical protein
MSSATNRLLLIILSVFCGLWAQTVEAQVAPERPPPLIARRPLFIIPPHITGVSPAGAAQGQRVAVTVTGQNTHFVQGQTTVNFSSGIVTFYVSVASPTSATAFIGTDVHAVAQTVGVQVATGTESLTLANAFGIATSTDPTIMKLQQAQSLGTFDVVYSPQFSENLPVGGDQVITFSTQGSAFVAFGWTDHPAVVTVTNPPGTASQVTLYDRYGTAQQMTPATSGSPAVLIVNTPAPEWVYVEVQPTSPPPPPGPQLFYSLLVQGR